MADPPIAADLPSAHNSKVHVEKGEADATPPFQNGKAAVADQGFLPSGIGLTHESPTRHPSGSDFQSADGSLCSINFAALADPIMLHSINHDQRLYVLTAGTGFSCLGFDVALRWAAGVAAWLREHGEVCAIPDQALIGTVEGYVQHQGIMEHGRKFNLRTGQRCDILLTPQLVGLERRRVAVTDQHGEKRRFWVGKSTGWLPVHLEIARSSSSGGPAVFGAPFQEVRVVR